MENKSQHSQQRNETGDDKLTPEQIQNWRRAFPETYTLTDEQVQLFRDHLQKMSDEANSTTQDQ